MIPLAFLQRPWGRLARNDVAAYNEQLISDGGAGLTGLQKNQLFAFARDLYSTLEQRVDFWDFSRNVGTGSTARSFHGRAGILTGAGVVWGSDGIVGAASGFTLVSVPSLLSAPPPNAVIAVARIIDGASTMGGRGLFDLQDRTAGGQRRQLVHYQETNPSLTRWEFLAQDTPGGQARINEPIADGVVCLSGEVTAASVNVTKNGTVRASVVPVTVPGKTPTVFAFCSGLKGSVQRFALTSVTHFDTRLVYPLLKKHLYPDLP